MKRRLALVALFFFVFAGTAKAQGPHVPVGTEQASADELKARGNQAMMELNYAEALAAYRAALDKSPNDWSLYYNIGRAQQARGDYPAALDALLDFDSKAPAETKAKVPSLAQLIADVKSHVGQINLHCSVDVDKGAVIAAVGKTDVGHSDGCSTKPKTMRVSLAAKSASVELRLEADGWIAENVKVKVDGGGAPVDAALAVRQRETQGTVRVVASPAAAVIAVDGKPKGNSPVEVTLQAGPHVVDVTADAYERAHVPFVVEAGGKKELNLTLEKTPPITKRWWFWAGTGVVAAGIITAVAILIIQPERDSTKGSIDPGVVRAPLSTF